MHVNRESTTYLVAGLLCILAVGMAASTLTAVVNTGTGGGPVGGSPQDIVDRDPGSIGGSTGEVNEGELEQNRLNLQACIPFLQTALGKLAIAAGALLVLYAIYWRFNISAAILSAWAGTPPVLFLYFALTSDCFSATPGGSGGGTVNPLTSGGQGVASPTSLPPWVIGGIFGIAVIGAIALVLSASGDEEIEPPASEETEEMPDLDVTDVAAAAGRAADRIEEGNVDIDNEVYRAWREMTQLLNVPNPDSSTPGEFAQVAIDVGMRQSDVNELTHLFEEVRYGGIDPTEEQEQMAVDTFRNIEDEYSETDERVEDDDPVEGDADEHSEGDN